VTGLQSITGRKEKGHMTGLEQIIKTIRAQAENSRDGILSKAQSRAKAVIADAEAEALRQSSQIIERAEVEAAELIKRAESGARREYAKHLLAERVALVDEVLQKALDTLCSLPDAEYSKALCALALRHAEPGAGQMLVSARDIKRLPADFEAKLNASLAERGASLAVKAHDGITGGGFVLVYGDIEHNCTFPALLEAHRDELCDLTRGMLFE